MCACSTVHAEPRFGQGIMVGELTSTSAVVQVRVTDGTALVDGDTFDDGDALRDGDLPGAVSMVEFFIRPVTAEGEVQFSYGSAGLVVVTADNDYIARVVVAGLQPGTAYEGFAEIKHDDASRLRPRADFSFRSLPGANTAAPTRFHVVTGMNYDSFFGNEGEGRAYEGEDRSLGYPALAAMGALNPDFVVFTGDDVYYDKNPPVRTLQDMRAKWHRQFALPRMIELMATTPGYWMKDDHDHRTNDSDAEGDGFPSHELGIATFREQAPVVAQDDDETPTYRTIRVSADLQIWMLEGRDYRSPNRMEDGPDKTIWGQEQRDWLMQTLLESDATFRVIITPTPMVGPDDAYKRDNHTNPQGFRHEGDAFHAWAAEQGLWDNTFLVCGDRHWQYHSIDPRGGHEFSSGAICDANSRIGRAPGGANSTDPDALITQPYNQRPASGGFLSVNCLPADGDATARIIFEFYEEHGELLYSYEPTAE